MWGRAWIWTCRSKSRCPLQLGPSQSQNQGGSPGLDLGELKAQLSFVDFYILDRVHSGKTSRFSFLKPHHLHHILELLLWPRKYKSLQSRWHLWFQTGRNIWIVVDWLRQMMLLHVLVVWFLWLCECTCDTAAGVQQVPTRSLVAL